MTDWVNFIRSIYTKAEASKTIPVFHPPASGQSINDCEKRLGVIFPNELKGFLLQTNGVTERVATSRGEVDSGHFLFSVERILEINTFQRTQTGDYTMPLDCLLFFAEDGIGDYFGFAAINGKVPHSRIYFWDHEDDSRRSIAPSLEYFVENWQLGKIKV
jgi:hypothetical protein